MTDSEILIMLDSLIVAVENGMTSKEEAFTALQEVRSDANFEKNKEIFLEGSTLLY